MPNSTQKINWWLLLPIIFVFVCWGLAYYFLVDDVQNRGTFGDMFGSVNALFSGLAFVGLVYAILLQRNELKLQREELEHTREELKGQKEVLSAQNKTAIQQNFDNTFFQLLRLHNDIVNAIDVRDENARVTFTGRDCFEVFSNYLNKCHMQTGRDGSGDELERIETFYTRHYHKHQSDLGHYFRNLYNIVKFVDNSNVPDKRLYTNLVRAQLSSYELVLLFYNCLSTKGKEKFHPIIEKYSLLKHLQKNKLLDQDNHVGYYSPKAYGHQ